jgi:hypothetical protein
MLRAGEPGITTHAFCSQAWPEKGNHTDPGVGFPLAHYLELCKRWRG